MFIKMRNYLSIALVTLVLTTSCSEYQKALKSEETSAKYALAEKLYKEGDYRRAIRLFDQIVPEFVGKPQGERVIFFYADTYYNLKDYYLAAYQFERFAKSYPKSDKAQEAAFLGAKCYYHVSPKYSIDQTDTHKAIEKLQIFINTYPNSEYVAEANTMVKELTTKLEKKEFEIGKLYFNLSDYKAAIASLNNFISDHPGSVFREEAMYYRFSAAYELGVNSVLSKMEERLRSAEDYYKAFKRYFPNSKYMKEVDQMAITVQEELKKFSK